MFEQIQRNIRELKQLTDEQKAAIHSLSEEEKTLLIYLFNDMLKYCMEVFDEYYLEQQVFYTF